MKLMLLCLLMPMVALADNWDAATYQQIEKSVQEPTFANRSFLITKYGASEKATFRLSGFPDLRCSSA